MKVTIWLLVDNNNVLQCKGQKIQGRCSPSSHHTGALKPHEHQLRCTINPTERLILSSLQFHSSGSGDVYPPDPEQTRHSLSYTFSAALATAGSLKWGDGQGAGGCSSVLWRSRLTYKLQRERAAWPSHSCTDLETDKFCLSRTM